MSRRPISPKLRFQILSRDEYRCRYCGTGAAKTELHIDHRVPVSAGGDNHPSNLLTACRACNLGKGALRYQSPDEGALEVSDYLASLMDWPDEGEPYLDDGLYRSLRACVREFGVDVVKAALDAAMQHDAGEAQAGHAVATLTVRCEMIVDPERFAHLTAKSVH